MTVESIIEAHLQQKHPDQKFTVSKINWNFSDVQGAMSLQHSHYSRVDYWLIQNDAKEVVAAQTLQAAFSQQGFTKDANKHPALDWAHLALCAQQLSLSLVEKGDAELWSNRVKVDKEIGPPRLETGKHGPELIFWSYKEYRSLPTVFRHHISVQANGQLTEDVSEGKDLPRLDR